MGIEERLLGLREGILGLVSALDEMGLEQKELPAGALEQLAELMAEVDGALARVMGKKSTRERTAKAARTAAAVERQLEELGSKLEPLLARELAPFRGEEGVPLVQLGTPREPDPELEEAYAEYLKSHRDSGRPGEPLDQAAFQQKHQELARLVERENEGTIDGAGLKRRAVLEAELWP